MISFTIFVTFVTFVSLGEVDCDYTSSSSGVHSSSDGTGGGFTQSNNNGQETFTSTNQQQGGGFTSQSGSGNPYAPGYYGPSNIFDRFGTPTPTYSPNFGYNPYFNAQPVYNPYPTQPFAGFSMPFMPFQSVPSPQEFNNYLNSLQQQYYQFYKAHLDYLNAFKNAQNQIPINGYGPNYAYATGTYGPNGIHQTAGVIPPNQNIPNIDINNRFNPDDNDNKPGYFGISTSSYSSSSDVNGIKTHKEGAETTVNDNGKITKYKISS